jgi:hypothetical protein
MADLVFLALIVGFFALMVLLVRACDRIIGPDDLISANRAASPAGPGEEPAP